MGIRLRLFSVLLGMLALQAYGQERTISLGIFTGGTASYIWDEGVNKDPRYEIRYDVRFSPIGICYGIDYDGFGFVLTPSIINVGQKYNVINTVGGQEGIRSGTLQYLNLPGALKIHIIDLSFFKVSFVAGASAAFLLSGDESLHHRTSKLRFPATVYPMLPAEYQIEYDGVVSPEVDKYTMLEKSDFKSLQLFVAAGFRSDWDITDNWRVSFDLRANYGVFEPRSDSYLERQNANQTIYDTPGKRRDIVAYLNVGIARYIDIDRKEADRKKGKSSARRFKPTRSSGRSKPKK